MHQPYFDCPSFLKCSSNICPLDPNISLRIKDKSDDKCISHKPTRHKIGLKYNELLKYQGFTKREYLGKKRWSELGDGKRTLILQALSKLKKTPKKGIVDELSVSFN